MDEFLYMSYQVGEIAKWVLQIGIYVVSFTGLVLGNIFLIKKIRK